MEGLRMTPWFIPSEAIVLAFKCCEQPFVDDCEVWTDKVDSTLFLLRIRSQILGPGRMTWYCIHAFLTSCPYVAQIIIDDIQDNIRDAEENYIA